MFYSAFNPRPAVNVHPGNRSCPRYSATFDERGVITPVQSGEFDMQDYINSSYSDTCIYTILERSLNDPSLLNVYPGHYGDFSDSPVSLAEVFKRRSDQLKKFESLPAELKDSFGDISGILDQLNDGTVFKTVNDFFAKKSKELKNESEVHADERLNS